MRSPKMARALRHYQAGETTQAETVCQQIVRDDPRQADAWNLLGVLAFQAGNAAAALDYIEHAVAAAPGVASHRGNRGAVLRGLGRFGEAEADFREVLRRSPVDADAHFNLGNVLRDLRRFAEAEASFRRALQLRPANPDALNSLGNVLRDLGRFDEAEAMYRRAVQLQPASQDAHTNLGNALRDLGRYGEAEECFRRALKLNPSYVEALNNLGVLLTDQGRAEEAVPVLQRALELRPAFAEAHNNVGLALRALNRHAEAAASYRRTLELIPAHTDAHFNLALLMLLRGDFDQGWAEYEWRFRHIPQLARSWPQPRWQGEALAGRTILLYAEQGLGDTLQFVRYAPLVHQRGATVLLDCPADLAKLLHTCAGIDRIVTPGGSLPPFDVQLPLLSLPGVLRTTLATIPNTIPYLAADAAVTERWRQELSPYPKFRIGIVWQGNPRFSQPGCRIADQKRSIPLARFEPVARLPGVQLFSLQKGYGAEQLGERRGQETLAERWGIVNLGDRLHDWVDTAAVMMNLDLIISADTSPAHLAGALGRPVWVALPFAGCWRWLLEREDTPWYPTMRLFRQRRPGDWSDVFARMARELGKL